MFPLLSSSITLKDICLSISRFGFICAAFLCGVGIMRVICAVLKGDEVVSVMITFVMYVFAPLAVGSSTLPE
jgi:hypothetical protein